MGETRVDLQHLLEDLRDGYAGPIEETILTEVVANALDASATTITLSIDHVSPALTIVDDGRGMKRRELARYHDIAASTKARGEGIGFAGVGIKLGLLVAREVVTETRKGRTDVATQWYLASRHRAPWKWVPPPRLVSERGTGVRLALRNPLSSLLDSGFLEHTIRLHFEPLLDPLFETVLTRHYQRGVRFMVDGRLLTLPRPLLEERIPVTLRLSRRRTPSAVGYLARTADSLPEQARGIAISTFGKIIKRGWDWLGISARQPDRITGVIEAPELAACLTLAKNDFVRTGGAGATYLAFRKALQEIVAQQLKVWDESGEREHVPPRTSKLDRDLERVLEGLASDFPLLDSLVARRRGGQKLLPMPGPDENDGVHPLLSLVGGTHLPVTSVPGGNQIESIRPSTRGPKTPNEFPGDATAELPGEGAVRRARYGLALKFERRPDDPELGHLVENTVCVNEAHPAYERAQASRSLGYHIALTVALSLAPLAVAPAEEHLFVTRFLAEWGALASARRDEHRTSRTPLRGISPAMRLPSRVRRDR